MPHRGDYKLRVNWVTEPDIENVIPNGSKVRTADLCCPN